MTAFVLDLVGLGADGRADRTVVAEVPSNFFTMLGIRPAIGRLILPGEGDQPKTGNVVVLGYSYGQKRFGGDPKVVGRSVSFDGRVTVIGVVENQFHGPYSIVEMDAYAPLGMHDLSDLVSRRPFAYARRSTIGRTSTTPHFADGTRAAMPMASSRSFASIM